VSRVRRVRKRPLLVVLIVLLLGGGVAIAPNALASWRRPPSDRRDLTSLEVRSLDGSNNNRAHPDWGKANTPYLRETRANFTDAKSAAPTGPNTRLISNRIFNDVNQNVFSENNISQWAWTWSQFLDHTFGLRDDAGEAANIPFDTNDPLETFTNNLGVIPFNRSAAVKGTGTTNARQQLNTVSSYIGGWNVYGGSNDRLEWLREGPVDGNLSNNSALLLLPNNMLPTRAARDDATTAPNMAVDGRLMADPTSAMVAGDVRANENIALTATHTLFAREHNRIVGLLPNWMTQEQKFQIARRVVIAEEEYVTYHEFLPTVGVNLSPYRGYNPRVNPSLSNEFATVGYRGHSMIHGEMEVESDASRYSADTLDAMEAQGVEVEKADDGVKLTIPLNVAFFNPKLLTEVQVGPMLQGLGGEKEYRNDEMIDNQLRSVMFQVPVAGNPECLDGPTLPQCFNGVMDLAALDIERGRDHGMPTYNQLRRAYGLDRKVSFTDITGERTESFPRDPLLTPGDEINDPNSLDFVALFDADGKRVTPGTPEAENDVIRGVRRTTLAARLKAVYGSVDKVDAFTGMVSEAHVPGTEFGELQLAMWRKQFQALRDGDRFFYLNDPGLQMIRQRLGIDYRHSLADLIALNTDIPRDELADNVFITKSEEAPAESPAPDPTATPTAQTPDNNGATPPPSGPAATPPAGSSRTHRRRRRKGALSPL
jgi:hypothetical protein